LEYIVRASDNASMVFSKIGLSADRLDQQLGDLSKRVATPAVDLKDTKFTLGMINAAKRLDKLSAMVADPSVEVDTRKAQTEILRITAMLDRLDAKRVNVTVDVDRRGGIFGRLFGGGGGGAIGGLLSAAGGGIGAAGSGIGAAGSAGGQVGQGIIGGGIAAAIASAVLTSPALIPVLLGGGVGRQAADTAAEQQLTTLRNSLRTATGARRGQIRAQIAALQSSRGPELAAFGGVEGVGRAALSVFSGALTAPGRGFSGGPGGHPGASFLTSLTAILQQIERFVSHINLGALFRASIPFLQLFVKFGEQAAKLILPVITQSLKEMQPFLPLIASGLLRIVKGFAGFLQAIGPSGMQASAKIFIVLTKIIEATLIGLGHTINWLAENVPTWVHDIAKWWDWLRHHTATVFDGIRHDIAHYWDMIYSNTIGAVIRIDKAVIGWFQRLPGQIVSALAGLGSRLWHLGAGWVTSMWNGIRHIWNNVIGWFKGLPGSILHAIGIGSPPRWAISAGEWIMKGLHIGLSKASGLPLGLAAGIASRIGSALGHGTGATAGGIQALAYQIAKTRGWANQWGAIQAVEMAEAGWSLTARNPSSGAYGIAQFINGPSEYYQWGGNPNTAAGQIVAFYNYIASRYRTPAAAWAHEQAFHWYGKGFHGMVNRPTIFGAGERGPERVDVTPVSHGRHGGALVNVGTMVVQDATDVALVAQRLSFAVTAAGLGS
jgi:hypothetical protein